jgi:hypothetical protein
MDWQPIRTPPSGERVLDTWRRQLSSLWLMTVLIIGGAATLAWIGVLLWAAFQGASWVFNALFNALSV